MGTGDERSYFWCLEHHRVEDDENACAWKDRLGPYDSHAEAERALTAIAERNERLDAEDEKWEQG